MSYKREYCLYNEVFSNQLYFPLRIYYNLKEPPPFSKKCYIDIDNNKLNANLTL